MLGDWRAHLNQISAKGGRVLPGSDTTRPKGQRARGRLPTPEPKPDGKATVDLQARTAISYQVR